MRTKKILKIIGIILIILLVLTLIHTIRNYIIIRNLQNKISKYSNSTNYFVKSESTKNDGTKIIMKYYQKDNKQAVFLEKTSNENEIKISRYNNGERVDTFTETKDSKVAQLDTSTLISVNIYNQLETDNKWQTFIGSIISNIRSEKCNDKECYVIKGFTSTTSLTFEETKIYIDKDTGLLVKVIEDETISNREYEFNNVEDTIFVEPDISQYTLKNN